MSLREQGILEMGLESAGHWPILSDMSFMVKEFQVKMTDPSSKCS